MERYNPAPVPVRSFAESELRPRFGIRSQEATAGNLEPHRHDYFEVWFFTSDAFNQLISFRERAAPRGSIFFIPPMMPHQLRFEPKHSCYVVYFDLAFLRPDLADHLPEIDAELLARAPLLSPFAYQQNIEFNLSNDSIDTADSLCQRMIAERRSPRLGSCDVTRSYLNLLFAEVARRYERPMRDLMCRHRPNGGVERHVRGVIKFISDNLTEKLTLVEAAEVVAVSPNYLAMLLKRETGKTFVELMTEKRMDRARELLAFTDMRIAQVSYAVGFADHNYFCKRFKRIVGCTPIEFRDQQLIAITGRPTTPKQALLA